MLDYRTRIIHYTTAHGINGNDSVPFKWLISQRFCSFNKSRMFLWHGLNNELHILTWPYSWSIIQTMKQPASPNKFVLADQHCFIQELQLPYTFCMWPKTWNYTSRVWVFISKKLQVLIDNLCSFWFVPLWLTP